MPALVFHPFRYPSLFAAALACTALAAPPARSQDLVINELMSANGATLVDEDGDTPDWVEVLNRGPAPIDLAGYGLSDGGDPLEWVFPSLVLAPGGYRVVFCSGKGRGDVPAHWETVIDQGDTWRYLVPAAEPPAAWRSPGFVDTAWSSGPTGIGYGDGDDRTTVPAGTISVYARKTFQIADPSTVLRVHLDLDVDDGFVAFLNGVEIARANMAGFGSPPPFNQSASVATEPRLLTGGRLFHYAEEEFRDLLRTGENVLAIQVHNAGSTSSDLSLIPLLTLGMTEAPANARGPAALIASTLSALHTSFKLSSNGEPVTLASPDGAIIDSVAAGWLPGDVSLGRYPDGDGPFAIHEPATPSAANASPGFAGVGGDVAFSHSGGFHSSALTLALSKADTAGEIRFTTDGAVPTEASARYTTPIAVSTTRVLRARTLGPGLYPGRTATHTFVFGRASTIPVVSISTAPYNFFDDDFGIYVLGPTYDAAFPHFGANFWEDWERPVHIELYEPSGALGLSAGAGVKIFGGWSRGNAQRSFSVFARGQYGAGAFDCRIFPDKRLRSFESFVLRNSGNDWQISHFRDAMMTSLLDALDVDRLAYRPANVYINGSYWGILNLREKINEHYLAANHKGVPADQIDLLEANGGVIHGDGDHYNALRTLLESNATLTPALYDQVASMMDVQNFIDYQAAQIYFDNTDWPGNNIKFWRPRTADGRWRWIVYDTDFGFGIWNGNNYQNNTLAFALEPNGPSWPNPPWSTMMLRRLVTHPGFVAEFANRFATHLSTIFAPARVIARIDAMSRVLDPEMPGQVGRWGGSIATWRSNVQVMRNFATYRASVMRTHLASRFGLGSQATLRIERLSTMGGAVEVHGVPIASYPFVGAYFRNLPVRLTARPDPGFRFTGWTGVEPANETTVTVSLSAGSATVSAGFEIDCAAAGDVVVNEIFYKGDPGNDPGDWVEIHNRSEREIALAGWTLRDQSDDNVFRFPSAARLAAGGYLVICSNLVAFEGRYGSAAPRLGDLGFAFDGDGDAVTLIDGDGAEVDGVAFNDAAPWPESPDGGGASLALRSPLLDNTHAPHWAASAAGGTPGARNDVFEDLEASCEGGGARFIRGDADGDGGITISDGIILLLANFAGGSVPCRAACDANGDGNTTGVTDAIHILRFQFASGPAPVAPFPGCALAPRATDALLGCESPPASCP